MAADLNNILDRFTTELQSWLDSPSDTSTQIAAMKKQIEGLKGEIGAEPLKAALKALEDGDRQVRRQRQKQAAEAIAAALKPLGIRLAHKPAGKPKRSKPPASKRGSPTTPSGSDAADGDGTSSPPPPTSAEHQEAS